MVAVDGSRMSHKAFDMACALRRDGEHIIVYHVSDARKKGWLPGYLGPEHLEIEFSGKLARAKVPHREGSVVVEERLGDDAVSSMILARAEAEKAHTLVVGAFGRKGPTIWSHGSNTDYSLKRAKDLTLVTTKPNSTVDSPQTFCVGHDGSKRAADAISYSLGRAKPGDKLFVVHIRSQSREAKGFDPIASIQKVVQTTVAESGVDLSLLEFVFIDQDHQSTIGQQLIKAAQSESIYASYLVVGRDGEASLALAKRLHMGTVCDYIAKKARITSIVVA